MARGARQRTASSEPVDGLWALPAGWQWEPLGQLGEWYGGGTPAKSNPHFWTGGDVPWVSPKDMKSARIDDTADHITPEAVASSATKLVPANSVMCVMRSGILKHSFPVAICSREVTLNQDLRAVHPYEDVDSNFLAHYLRRSADAILHGCSKDGTTVDSIETSRLLAWPVPIPPPDVQRRIVARIDALFAEIDEGERALAAAREGVETYRKSLLKAAVTGELTADWRRANPAAETGEGLLRRILADRRAKRDAASSKRAKQHSGSIDPPSGDPSELPKGWVWVTLGEVFDVCVGATPSRGDAALWDGTVPWVSSGEVAFCRIRRTRESITSAAVAADRIHPPGTVLLGIIGEGRTRGQAAILDVAAAHNQNCASIRVSETPIPPEYVYEYLVERYQETRTEGAGGNQPALNKSRVQAMPMPLPPLAEMHEIVRRLSAARAHHDELADSLAQAGVGELRQSILAAAFRGELAR